MNIEHEIRKLAKSSYWLRLYNSSKNIGTIALFDNTTNLSGKQILFLYWIEIYSLLYKELSEKEWINLDQEVINDDCRCDAFLYWRGKSIERDLLKYKEDMRHTKKGSKNKGKGQTMNIWNGPKNKDG